MAAEVLPKHEELMRRALFTPCSSKAELARWIRIYLGLDFPDCIVSEESNSTPMDMIWECYSRCKSNDVEDFSRVMAYASRGGYKTLGASVLEVLQVLHLGRNVAHMSAILEQSKKSQEYIRDFFSRPYLRDFRVGQNLMKIDICRYENAETGRILTLDEFVNLTAAEKRLFRKRYANYIQIIVCTMAGANSAHTEFFVVDEVDVVPKQHVPAYETAKHIPKARDGKLPVTLLTSTRKFSYGLVQREIDQAAKKMTQLRHWNVIDITERCPASRHLPEQPKVKLYVDDLALQHIPQADYDLLDVQAKKPYVEIEGFAGCAKCPLFSACKGRLATHQKGSSSLLQPIVAAIGEFRAADSAKVQTELLCRKPDQTGLIYPRFNRHIHMLPATKIASMVTGDPCERMDKAGLLNLLLEKGARFYAGMDFGFTHNFAVVLGARWGQFMFVVSVLSMAGLELDDKIAVCDPLRRFKPIIFGDPEAKPDIVTFKRKGFHMREWDKYAGSVKAGIEIVRMKFQPSAAQPQLFMLKDDLGCELLAARLEKYHFLTDAAGQVTEEPDEENDDECDALRYLVMNVYAPKGKVLLPTSRDLDEAADTMKKALQPLTPGKSQDWMDEKIRSLTGEDPTGEKSTKTISKGRFFFDG